MSLNKIFCAKVAALLVSAWMFQSVVLAAAFTAERFTDSAVVDKWFKRNCKDVLPRECTAPEKADVLAGMCGLPHGLSAGPVARGFLATHPQWAGSALRQRCVDGACAGSANWGLVATNAGTYKRVRVEPADDAVAGVGILRCRG
jgi:hypothetical protein